jgi:hypothetical protein
MTTRNPKIVTLCGSMRFFDKMLTVAAEETAKGHIVIAPFSVVAKEDQGSDFKKMLDELHFRKIDMADEIIVVTDENGYIGESTRREMVYAIQTGKFNGADNVREIPSSPVVPAPTETGPWPTWEAGPEGVTVKSANGERFRKTGVGAIHLLTNGVGDCCKISVANDLQPAPFVAAEEG